MKAARVTRVLVSLVVLVQAFDIASGQGPSPLQPTNEPLTTGVTTLTSTNLPDTTTVSPPNITTTHPPPSTTTTTTSTPPPSTTTSRPSTTTVFPPTPTPTPCPPNKCHFDVLSFMGGIILTIGIEAIIFILWIFCKHGGKRSYNRL